MSLTHCVGLGVAGNFAKHLEQAGEIHDFKNVTAAEGAPKGIFPFYLPKSEGQLSIYPISSTTQVAEGFEKPQLEPEVALLCDLTYENGLVKSITPQKFAAFNDCTLRRHGAKKISEKKNWGEGSKGLSETWIELDSFTPQGKLNQYRLASFVKRDGVLHPYGVDTEVRGYSYCYQTLIDWLVTTCQTQTDHGPLEDIASLLRENDFPSQLVIAIGATAYESFGEHNYLQAGDEVFVAVYPDDVDNIASLLDEEQNVPNASILHQKVI